MEDRDYYCSYKFRYLKIDLESKTTYTCHAATPHKIDVNWLEKNPGQIFNNDINVSERKMMLVNERNASCEQNCWTAEDHRQVSPRQWQGGASKTHTEVYTKPEIIDLTLSSDCNLTCSYCCKEFSKAWRRDILNNGGYKILGYDDERFNNLSNKDKLLLNVKQPTLKNSKHYKFLFNEIKQTLSELKRLEISGGEPFLDNSLIDILTDLTVPSDAIINLYTGLGVSSARFKKILNDIKPIAEKYANFQILVSAENTNEYLEFNRYGIKWVEFNEKIKLLNESNINYKFHCTITNTTIHGFRQFCDYFDYKVDSLDLTFAYQPSFLSAHIIDDDSKKRILTEFSLFPEEFQKKLASNLQKQCSEKEKLAAKSFIQEFVNRRTDLSVDIFPESFKKWLNL